MPGDRLLLVGLRLELLEPFGMVAVSYTHLPAVVFVRDGASRVVTRRETYEDLYQRDL